MIQKDKIKHFAISLLIVLIFLLIFSTPVAIGATIILGVAKEIIYDRILGYGKFDRYDIVANLMGIATGVIFYILLLKVS